MTQTSAQQLKNITDRAEDWRAHYGLDLGREGNHRWEGAHALHHSAATLSAIIGAGERTGADHDTVNAALVAQYLRDAGERAPRLAYILLELEEDPGGFDSEYYDPGELLDIVGGIDTEQPDHLSAYDAVDRWANGVISLGVTYEA